MKTYYIDESGLAISHTQEISKMFSKSSKYFSFMPPASWVPQYNKKFSYMLIAVYDLRVLKHFKTQKIKQEKLVKFVVHLNYTKFSYINFCSKKFQYLQTIHYRRHFYHFYHLPTVSVKVGSIFYLQEACTNSTILLDTMLQSFIPCIFLFSMLCIV